ncbi:MAG: mannose-1-phosphate guanylyltransferase/mannose-6-phosphate isomerase [Alphaproteobacteria bacterium]|nr:mannose-1-phosphate guanylyltransferase/mannose-6-phosphate isomerase [Alphaproteobacteria bacterium]
MPPRSPAAGGTEAASAPPLRAAILCGGAGTRLWPLSRDAAPKQFHALVGARSMLTETVARAIEMPGAGRPLILTAAAFGATAAEHAALAGAADAEIILEPSGRNTAPAAALAALAAADARPDTVVVLLPSDHHIARPEAFRAALADACTLAAQGAIVTLGIVPEGPHTGYGYIRRGAALGGGYEVARFIEKPGIDAAHRLLAEGGCYWNAGIFVFRADVYLHELRTHRPDIAGAAEAAWRAARRDGPMVHLDPALWAACPGESIDYAVAEKTAHAAVVPVDMGWNDVGSWLSLKDLAARDAAGNTLIGDAHSFGARDCYVRATSRHVALVGVQDLIVVETPDAVLIVHKDAAQDVKAAATQPRAPRSAS